MTQEEKFFVLTALAMAGMVVKEHGATWKPSIAANAVDMAAATLAELDNYVHNTTKKQKTK